MNTRKLISLTIFMAIFILWLTGCNKESDPIPEVLGKQYYRMIQYDFDGDSTIYYSSSLVENKNPRRDIKETPIALTCETDGVSLLIGYIYTWITIKESYHDGTIIIDNIPRDPNFCLTNSCTWAIQSNLILETKFTTNGKTYYWTGVPFDCESLPITLKEFRVEPRKDGTNIITIVTASEINADYAVIERSPNIETWTKVGNIHLTNNPQGTTYTLID